MHSMSIEEVKKYVNHLISTRQNREKKWRQLADYVLPNRGNFESDTYNRAEKRNTQIINNGAQRALLRSAAGLTSAMTPTTLPWFKHDYKIPEQREAAGARLFTERLDDIVGSTLSEGGFYQAIHEFNQELLGFGCALLFLDQSLGKCQYSCVPVGSFAVSTKEDKSLLTVVRKLTLTANQGEAKFGKERLSHETQTKLATNPYSPVNIYHFVTPRATKGQSEENTNMPFASYFFEENGKDFLSVSGFYEMPYFFTAWSDVNSVYGIGLGDNAIDDQRQIDALETRKIIGIDKVLDPPMKASSSYKKRFDTFPGAVNPMASSVIETAKPLFEVNFAQALPYVQAEIDKISLRIDDNMFASTFADIPLEARPAGISATEWVGRRKERIQLMEPSLSAYEPRVLLPLLSRTLGILERASLLPLPPESLGEVTVLDIEFTSPLSQVLREIRGQNARSFMDDVLLAAQANPESLDKVNFDQYLDEMAYAKNVPGSIVRSDDEVQQIREMKAKQAQQQAQAEMLMQMSGVSKNE